MIFDYFLLSVLSNYGDRSTAGTFLLFWVSFWFPYPLYVCDGTAVWSVRTGCRLSDLVALGLPFIKQGADNRRWVDTLISLFWLSPPKLYLIVDLSLASEFRGLMYFVGSYSRDLRGGSGPLRCIICCCVWGVLIVWLLPLTIHHILTTHIGQSLLFTHFLLV